MKALLLSAGVGVSLWGVKRALGHWLDVLGGEWLFASQDDVNAAIEDFCRGRC